MAEAVAGNAAVDLPSLDEGATATLAELHGSTPLLVEEIVGMAARSLRHQVHGGWGFLIGNVAVNPQNPVLGLVITRSALPTAGRTLDLNDWSAIAALVGVEEAAVVEAPVGDEISLVAHMIDERGLSDDHAALAAVIVRSWLNPDERDRTPALADFPGGQLTPRTVTSKQEFRDVLANWLGAGPSSTLSDRGRGAVLRLRLGEVDLALAGDTTQVAVRQFLSWYDRNSAQAPWHVLPNRSGKCNKVSFSTEAVPGWYCYLAEAWPSPGLL